jgi:predicted MFS family arabinose efflux permease
MLKFLQEVKALVPKWLSVLLFLAGLKLIYPHWYEGLGPSSWNPRFVFDWLTAFFLSACNFVNTVWDATPWWGICLAIFLPLSFVYCIATGDPYYAQQFAEQAERDKAWLAERDATTRWVGGWFSTGADIRRELKPGEHIRL